MARLTGVEALRPGLPEPVPPAGSAPKRKAGEAVNLPAGTRVRIFQPTGQVYAEVLDPATREVVKTIPPLELLKLMARIQHYVGLLVDRES